MEYRPLGKTGLNVSALALGTMTWGQQNTEAEAFEQMDYALERGINFFDTAEMYPVPPSGETQGRTESYIGNWLTSRKTRDRIILATKVAGRGENNPGVQHVRGGPRLNREHIQQAIDSSLQRLQTDYVDLYQLHWPERDANFFGKLDYRHSDDDGVSPRETLEVLAELVQQGKVRHVGLSNETPWGVMHFLSLAKEFGLPVVASVQNPYSLVNRTYEAGLAEVSMREHVGLLAYSPLGGGVLSGKYLNGQRPEGARMTLFDRFTRYSNARTHAAVAEYVAVAGKHGLDPAQMALAFVTSREFVTSNIIGATSMAQLKSNIDSAALVLDQALLQEIDQIHTNNPNPAP